MMMAKPSTPDILVPWMAPFAACFTHPTWRNVLLLMTGAILAPGRRTVASALSAMGLRHVSTFTNFHRVLNRNRWSSRALARRLLALLVGAFVPHGPVVVGIDETLERRWGRKIKARGIYRDPVRSSRGHFVKASGLRWVSVMLLAPVPWAGRVWASPSLTVLAPSERFARQHGRRHKRLTEWARQVLLLAARWLPDRQVIAVADSSYAAIELLDAVRSRLTFVTRLRLDARLFEPAPPRRPGTIGRPRVAGARLPTLAERLADPTTCWHRVDVTGWYGRSERRLDVLSGTAVWYHTGLPAVPIRYVLVRDVAGAFEPQAFLCTDLAADPLDILRWFVRRWSIEVTFAEVRRHLGMETQRQWSDPAIARTTPLLLGLFSLITLWADGLAATGRVPPRRAAWYPKPALTFSDALAAVRYALWTAEVFPTSADNADVAKIPRATLQRLTQAACFPA
ncbi:MAG TPA: transposase [Geminicoccaceae bacterium]|nr:transposase [Geminicoccaceae bacterium]